MGLEQCDSIRDGAPKKSKDSQQQTDKERKRKEVKRRQKAEKERWRKKKVNNSSIEAWEMSTAFDSLSWRGGVSVTISIDDRLVGKSSSDWSSQRCWNDSSALLARLNCLLSSSFQSKVSCSLCLFLSFWLSLATKPTASATTTTTTTALYCLCLSIRVVWIPGDDTTVSPPRHGFVILPAPIYGSPSRDPSILLDLFLFYLSFLFSVYLCFLLFFTSVWHFRFFSPSPSYPL